MKHLGLLFWWQFWRSTFTYIFLQTTPPFKHSVNAIGDKQNVERGWDPPLIVVDRCVPLIPPEFFRVFLDSRKRVAENKKKNYLLVCNIFISLWMLFWYFLFLFIRRNMFSSPSQRLKWAFLIEICQLSVVLVVVVNFSNNSSSTPKQLGQIQPDLAQSILKGLLSRLQAFNIWKIFFKSSVLFFLIQNAVLCFSCPQYAYFTRQFFAPYVWRHRCQLFNEARKCERTCLHFSDQLSSQCTVTNRWTIIIG